MQQQAAYHQESGRQDTHEYLGQLKNSAVLQTNGQYTAKANIKLSGSLGAASNSSSANQLRQHNKTSDMIILHQGSGPPTDAYQYDARAKHSHLSNDKVPASALPSAGSAGSKGQNSSQVNIQNPLGGSAPASGQALVSSASGSGPRIYFVTKQNAPGGAYLPAQSDSPHLYYNQKDGMGVGATPVNGSSQIPSPAQLSASCDDRAHILGQRQPTVQEQKSRTATAAPYTSKKRDGAPGGYGVLENVFIQ